MTFLHNDVPLPQFGNEEEVPSSQQAAEITRDEAIRSLLTNEELSDLTLRGSDGSRVVANRCFLASRSPVFCRMLFGKFSEASEKTVDIGYDGVVLKAIVEYIYMDKITMLEEKDNDEVTSSWDIYFIRFLLHLVDAANYFALPELRRKVEGWARTQMKRHSELATLFLTTSSGPDCVVGSKVIQECALEIVKQNPRVLLDGNKSDVALIHPFHMEEILKQDYLPMDELSCFELLQMWATGTDAMDNNSRNPGEGGNDWQSSRKHAASQMTEHLRLENIDATDLLTTVTLSGLVTTEQLCEAFKIQDLRARRQIRTWNSSKTNIVKNRGAYSSYHTTTLEGPILKSGVHKWRIKVLEFTDPEGYTLGVASTCWSIESDERLSSQKGGWGLVCGMAIHVVNDGYQIILNDNLPLFSAGSTVSFTLDLDRGGILTASIDGNAPFQMFDDMCRDHGEGHGFVPAVTLKDGTVEFLGFEDVI